MVLVGVSGQKGDRLWNVFRHLFNCKFQFFWKKITFSNNLINKHTNSLNSILSQAISIKNSYVKQILPFNAFFQKPLFFRVHDSFLLFAFFTLFWSWSRKTPKFSNISNFGPFLLVIFKQTIDTPLRNLQLHPQNDLLPPFSNNMQVNIIKHNKNNH